MRSLALCLPAFAGFSAPKTYAAWPVWSDSTTKEIKFQPLPKKAATKLWHRARDFDRQTRKPDCHGGAVGHSALQVLHALIFDFLNYANGRLDPSYEAIAKAANVCARTVANALKRLKELGILNWVRRCTESRTEDGRFVLEQETNAYAVLPASQWRGYREPPEPPPPASGTWGDHPPCPLCWHRPPTNSVTAEVCGACWGSSIAIQRTAWPLPSRGLVRRCKGEIFNDLPDCTPCKETLPHDSYTRHNMI